MDALSSGNVRWRDGLRAVYNHRDLNSDMIGFKAAEQSEYVFRSSNVSILGECM